MEMLIDAEIEKIVGTIILHGDKNYVQPASYDIRVGEEIYLPERAERQNLKTGDFQHLQPFESVLIKTLEEVIIPKDMTCLVQPSSKLSTRGLMYTGGSIDPGYEGYLWINIRNMAPMHEKIEFGQPIASIQFIRMKDSVKKGYAEEHGGRIEHLPKDRVPHKPERTLYDWIQISTQLDSIDSQVNGMKTSLDHVEKRVSGFLDTFLYAAIAGIIAGLVIAIFKFIFGSL
jgi:deoxycytidine triphosphate deaminase